MQLFAEYQHYVKAAEYVDGRKVAGVRSLGRAKGQLTVLRDHFGSCRLRSITLGDVRQFRAARLAQETRTKTQRTITSVNRELSMLRRMLNVTQREGWILSSPFAAGDSLISVADENKRERILTREEEVRLLAACETPQRAHLKGILICALDTGMRQGEIFSLRWRDVEFENGLLNIRAFHTKTMKERQVAVTHAPRVRAGTIESQPPPTIRTVWCSASSTTSNEASRQREARRDWPTYAFTIYGTIPSSELCRVMLDRLRASPEIAGVSADLRVNDSA